MATRITCDICQEIIRLDIHVIRVRLDDGEYPHNGSTMHKMCDVCVSCASKLSRKKEFVCALEYEEVIKL